MRGAIERYVADRGSLLRFYTVEGSPTRQNRLKQFYAEWLATIARLNFDAMSADGRIDYVLFRNHLDHELRRLDIQAKARGETAPLIPFAGVLQDLEENRRRMEPVDSARAASVLNGLAKQIQETRKTVESGAKVKPALANRAATAILSLRNTLKNWNGFYSGYEPVFTWWTAEPYKAADQRLQEYAAFLREKVAGVKAGDEETIVGDPIGREALLSELAFEMIPYTPEELIEIANRELAWCEAEMKRASRDLGHGEDWKKALEHVKTLHVEPGKQPELIRKLALEALEFLDRNNLVTVPQLARDTWRMEMMPPRRQLVNPFFTGGETISVSFPTSGMQHEQKLMSLRGNNIHFSRATVHHELIPGHHLQGFMSARYRAHRGLFRTAFAQEGWALYWELLLWDLKFPQSAEDRIGFLFWRMHRCARIIFSLSFHLEKMTAQECIDFLVQRVGHEPANAAGEVRRSFNGSYGPLYQAAYLLGGLQIRALRRDLTGPGKMTDRDFHDAVLKQNGIPIEMIRASLTKQKPARDFVTAWKFYGR
ncbi:MAG: DUF885 family protein [Candidatus Solibacter usitatus]|nr:DUF885 family protein [Candidatus Solibacter usitatus]